MVFGQGALRAHPFASAEVFALEKNDIAAFDRAFFGHVGQQGSSDGGVVGELAAGAKHDFGHGLGRVPADSAGLLAQEPVEPAQVTADELGIGGGDPRGRPSLSLGGAPRDEGIGVVGERNQGAQGPLARGRSLGDLLKPLLLQQFPQLFFH